MKHLSLGQVMLDVVGTELEAADRRRLEHPSCAGVILFARNYKSPDQLRTLCDEIKAVRDPQLLIAVDQEGGRVQRFREGFTAIPPMRKIGECWNLNREHGIRAARDAALVIGTELAAFGIDFSFAPVLDIDHNCNSVIGNRAFHTSPDVVIDLGEAFISGLHQAGMIAVGKHFPGHGGVETDSHHNIAIDSRKYEEIERTDLRPFTELCNAGLGAVMPAHVIYERMDARPAGFSSFWLQEILRERIGFNGMIFSDDLSMEGASIAGGAPDRAKAAIAAGCDIVLVCNAPDDANAVLDAVGCIQTEARAKRIQALHHRTPQEIDSTSATDTDYASARENIVSIAAASLELPSKREA